MARTAASSVASFGVSTTSTETIALSAWAFAGALLTRASLLGLARRADDVYEGRVVDTDRTPCCLDPKQRIPCGTRWAELRKWACSTTGKGVRTVTLGGTQQGKAPFWAQPVGYDG